MAAARLASGVCCSQHAEQLMMVGQQADVLLAAGCCYWLGV